MVCFTSSQNTAKMWGWWDWHPLQPLKNKWLHLQLCPRVTCACIEQEPGRLKWAFWIWVSNCCKEPLKTSLLLRNHPGQKAKLIIIVISFFLLLLTGKHFCCSPFWVCWECLAWGVAGLLLSPNLLYQAHRAHLPQSHFPQRILNHHDPFISCASGIPD